MFGPAYQADCVTIMYVFRSVVRNYTFAFYGDIPKKAVNVKREFSSDGWLFSYSNDAIGQPPSSAVINVGIISVAIRTPHFKVITAVAAIVLITGFT